MSNKFFQLRNALGDKEIVDAFEDFLNEDTLTDFVNFIDRMYFSNNFFNDEPETE